MVRATTSLDTKRYDLETIEGAWVEIRPMTYGQFLQRRDMAMKMGMSGKGGAEKVDIDMMQEAVTRFEFKVCIADHNLEDENERKLTLSEPGDFNRLDPRVGQEISSLIDSLIQWENPKSPEEVGDGDQEGDTVSEDSST